MDFGKNERLPHLSLLIQVDSYIDEAPPWCIPANLVRLRYAALCAAAENGHPEAVRALLEAGAEVDHASDDGFTALHVAAQNGHTAVIQALVGPRM